MVCQNCQTEFEGKFCPNCGKHIDLPQGAYQQPNIIINNNATATAAATAEGSKNISPKKKWTAFFLCLFLGYLGVHRFYVGKIGTGIIWLCSGGLFFVGYIIDLISILSGGFRDKNGAFLK